MTIYQTPLLSEILGDEEIPQHKLAYFRRRLANRIHSLVLSEFMRLEKDGKLTRSQLAQRIGRAPEQVTRWLGSSGNWTIETISDLLLAMKCEPSISILSLSAARGEAQKNADIQKVIPANSDNKMINLVNHANTKSHAQSVYETA